MSGTLIEAAVKAIQAAIAAVEARAGRAELCADLDAGGFTPVPELPAKLRPRVTVQIFPTPSVSGWILHS
jgi:copper homeostasis protein CutC